MQQDTRSIWEWQPKGRKCRRKHVWVYYQSQQFRECIDCPTREALWADIGVVKLHKKG